MTMERDSLVARLEEASDLRGSVHANSYVRELCRDAAAALSRPKQVVTPTSERPTSDALAETQGPYEARLCKDIPTVDAAEQFARWLEQGPKLAKAAGCYVAIKVTGGKP